MIRLIIHDNYSEACRRSATFYNRHLTFVEDLTMEIDITLHNNVRTVRMLLTCFNGRERFEVSESRCLEVQLESHFIL